MHDVHLARRHGHSSDHHRIKTLSYRIPKRDKRTLIQLLQGVSNDGHIRRSAEEFQISVRRKMLAASCQSSFLIPLDELSTITRDLLWVVANRSHAKRLIANIGEHI